MKIVVKNNIKIIILIVSVLLITMIIALIGAINTSKNEHINDSNQSYSLNKSEEELKKIISSYNGKFIKIQSSSEQGFAYDIYLYFPTDLFENEESKEYEYTHLINAIVNKENKKIRLIDTSRDITIRVFYNYTTGKYYYTINGEDNYFSKYSSQISLKNYSKVDSIELNADSNELKNTIKNNWKCNNDIFGTKESVYDDYDIFFEEGIKVKRINTDVFNIVFNNKYNSSVVNGIKVGTEFEEIEKILGKAPFSTNTILGYKGEDFYVFFEDDAISIYRNSKYDYDEFEDLLRKYLNSELDVKQFINDLTYLWPDYTSYDYSSEFVYLKYNRQGVIINLTSNSSKNISVLKNYGNIDGVKDLITDKKLNCDFENDGIFNCELERIGKNSVFVDYNSLPSYVGRSNRFMAVVKANKVDFKAIDDTNDISCRLVETVNSYLWFSDTVFVYSVENKGIYYFDLETREKSIIIEGDERYNFTSFENGKLIYDEDKSIELGD